MRKSKRDKERAEKGKEKRREGGVGEGISLPVEIMGCWLMFNVKGEMEMEYDMVAGGNKY